MFVSRVGFICGIIASHHLHFRQDLFRFFFMASLQAQIIKSLEQQRKALGISKAEWLRRANVRESTYYRWQGCKTQPTIKVLQRLADALEQP
jgi:hypothetical protein